MNSKLCWTKGGGFGGLVSRCHFCLLVCWHATSVVKAYAAALQVQLGCAPARSPSTCITMITIATAPCHSRCTVWNTSVQLGSDRMAWRLHKSSTSRNYATCPERVWTSLLQDDCKTLLGWMKDHLGRVKLTSCLYSGHDDEVISIKEDSRASFVWLNCYIHTPAANPLQVLQRGEIRFWETPEVGGRHHWTIV